MNEDDESIDIRKDLAFFKKSGDKSITKQVERIFEEPGKDPYNGIGKPEDLKHDMAGLWSRRLDKKHRLVIKYSPSLQNPIPNRYENRLPYFSFSYRNTRYDTSLGW